MTNDVIARRVYKIDGCDVECRFYRPMEEDGSFFCQFQIDWPEGTEVRKTGGVDEVQALLLGMVRAHTSLLLSRSENGRSIEWLGDESLGMPVAQSIRDLDPENRL